jgi:hypothetical protein
MKESINQIITALFELEAKGCHSVFFEYGSGLFCARIYSGEQSKGKVLYERTINIAEEQAELEKLHNLTKKLKLLVCTTVFQCYRRKFVKDEKSGDREKTGSIFEVGENAMQAMQIDGSGYFTDDPDNGLQYYTDMKQVSETV